jgi:hypothetical protein
VFNEGGQAQASRERSGARRWPGRQTLLVTAALGAVAVLSFAALAFASVNPPIVPGMPKTALPGQQLAVRLKKRMPHACTVWMEQSRRVTDRHQIPPHQLSFTMKSPDHAGKATLHVQCGKLAYRAEVALVTPAPSTGEGTFIPALGRSGGGRVIGSGIYAGNAISSSVLRTSIVSIAESQDQSGARVVDSPANSDCNPYTAYWGDGSASGCAAGLRSNAWCADFAAWVWRRAGVSFIYGFTGSDINAWAASFYFWGLATGNWHPLSSGYSPQAGDVAVYGNLTDAPGPGHVGIYVGGPSSSPTVVNGNWAVNWPNPTNYGVISQTNETNTGIAGGGLDGYVSPGTGSSGGGSSGGTTPGSGSGSPGSGSGGSGPANTNGYQLAFQANTHELIAFGASATSNTGQGMMPGTSPSVAALAGGGYEMAFQANTGNLIVFGTGADINTGQGMKAGTSPSIAASPSGGFEVAFQANTGNLYTYNSASGPANLQQGMDNETSPSIAALAGGGYEMAFQANTTNLIVFGAGGNVNTGQGMKPGTSPGIAASPAGGFQAAFQANTGNLYTYNSASGPANLQQGMDNETSPGIAP